MGSAGVGRLLHNKLSTRGNLLGNFARQGGFLAVPCATWNRDALVAHANEDEERCRITRSAAGLTAVGSGGALLVDGRLGRVL